MSPRSPCLRGYLLRDLRPLREPSSRAAPETRATMTPHSPVKGAWVKRATCVAILLLTTTSASAQTARYVTGHVGLSGGDGGAAPAAGGAVGYVTSRRLAFLPRAEAGSRICIRTSSIAIRISSFRWISALNPLCYRRFSLKSSRNASRRQKRLPGLE